ncbi:formate--tetrahydrofolate ligase [Hugenholtzia roseola]|uniref:formate--tetrahydrofolate ligase n=1 Tax=Hugenholtzia roseola TaxID=1002 RepID=UPI0003FB5248|nr:formate--tetrahydrofolate ligase [Hugenholtzia roseola]
MKTDIEIARQTPLQAIQDIATTLGIDAEALIPYGKHIAKVPYSLIAPAQIAQNNLILVTAITPTKAGIGKTTTSVGLALGLSKLLAPEGKKALVALREPSLGPCFGMKGGAAGGGYAQVLPMEDINLHFTGDFHAITSAHNMIAALLDNYQYQNRGTEKALKEIVWKRVLDVNDRSLRFMVSGLGGNANGLPQETGFDITPASELMAILCLAESLDDLRQKIARIVLGYTFQNQPFTVQDLGVTGAILVLLKNAIHPNLVQTTENTPAFVHGGPFANIAHGCNTVLATKLALSFGDYVITEAGFGADLGAEKFFNIKCRKAGLAPKVTVLVVTSQALKLHGGVPESQIKMPSLQGLEKGLENVKRHVENLQAFGQSVVMAFNQYHFDTEAEIAYLEKWAQAQGIAFALNDSFSKGSAGAMELAQKVLDTIAEKPAAPLHFTYDLEDDIPTKLHKITTQIYRGKGIILSEKAKKSLQKIQKWGKEWEVEKLPVCIAKTQYSFSDDPTQLGVAQDFELHIEDLILNNGAGFIVAVAGNIMRMPGLPKVPQALFMDIIAGEIVGLS